MTHRDVRPITLLLGATLLAACATNGTLRLVDMTYAFDEHTIYWPNNKGFEWHKTDWGMGPGGYWYASATYAASEHGGTHIDAPIHFGRDQTTVDLIPLDRLIGPAVVIDVRPQCADDPDHELTVAEIRAWEARYGPIEPGSLVLVFTGWGERWPDRKRYLGSETPDAADTLHFPGLSREAAGFLVAQRSVRGVGIDTASIDPGRSRDFQAHRVLNGVGVYALENVAALDQLPARGATVLALPIKIKGGTGGPVRIVGMVPR